MKIYSNDISQLCNLISAGKVDGLLLHGPNYGLSNIIFEKISRQFDFLKSTLSLKSDGLTALEQKANMANFFGRKEIIRIQDFPSSISKDKKELLAKGSFVNFICFVAQDSLPPSGIRKYFEEAKNLAAVACYYDDAQTISSAILKKAASINKHIEEDALYYLKTHLVGDRQVIANELKKLFLYCENKNVITLKEVTACLSSQILASGDEMCLHFASNTYDEFLAEIATLKEQNINEVLMIRALQRFYMNLYIVLNYHEDGMNLDLAIKKLTPPIFFKLIPRFKEVIRKTSSLDAKKMIRLLLDAEIEYKSNSSAFDLFLFLTKENTV